jgi:hypothetical protein
VNNDEGVQPPGTLPSDHHHKRTLNNVESNSSTQQVVVEPIENNRATIVSVRQLYKQIRKQKEWHEQRKLTTKIYTAAEETRLKKLRTIKPQKVHRLIGDASGRNGRKYMDREGSIDPTSLRLSICSHKF